MADLCPWQNSDIKLQHLIRQAPLVKKRRSNKHSLSQAHTQDTSTLIFAPKNRIPRLRRLKTCALGPAQGSVKLIEKKRSLTKLIKQTIDLKFIEGQSDLHDSLKKKDIHLLQKQRSRQRDIIKQQLASKFLKQASKQFTSIQSKKQVKRSSLRSSTEMFLPMKLLNKQKRQDSLILPRIKLGSRKEKMLRDKRYFFEDSQVLELISCQHQ